MLWMDMAMVAVVIGMGLWLADQVRRRQARERRKRELVSEVRQNYWNLQAQAEAVATRQSEAQLQKHQYANLFEELAPGVGIGESMAKQRPQSTPALSKASLAIAHSTSLVTKPVAVKDDSPGLLNTVLAAEVLSELTSSDNSSSTSWGSSPSDSSPSYTSGSTTPKA